MSHLGCELAIYKLQYNLVNQFIEPDITNDKDFVEKALGFECKRFENRNGYEDSKQDSKQDCERRLEILKLITEAKLLSLGSEEGPNLFDLDAVEGLYKTLNNDTYDTYLENEKLKEEQKKEAEQIALEEACGEGAKKCEKSEKVASDINAKYADVLKYKAVIDECANDLIIDTTGAQKYLVRDTANELVKFSPKELRKCKRTAKKMSKLVKKADKVNVETKICLELTDFKAIKNCIKKGKIEKTILRKYLGVIKKTAVEKECAFYTDTDYTDTENNIFSDIYSVKDVKRCQRAAKKMSRYIKKSNKKYGGKCLNEKSLELVKSCLGKLKKAEKDAKKKLKKEKKDEKKAGKKIKKKGKLQAKIDAL